MIGQWSLVLDAVVHLGLCYPEGPFIREGKTSSLPTLLSLEETVSQLWEGEGGGGEGKRKSRPRQEVPTMHSGQSGICQGQSHLIGEVQCVT